MHSRIKCVYAIRLSTRDGIMAELAKIFELFDNFRIRYYIFHTKGYKLLFVTPKSYRAYVTILLAPPPPL